MESTIILSSAACIDFAVYYEMVDVTYLDHITASTQFAQGWINEDGGYADWQIVTGFIVGCISAFVEIYIMLNIGICKQFFFRLRERTEKWSFIREVLPPTLGGLCIGKLFHRLHLSIELLTFASRSCKLGFTCNFWKWKSYL